MCAIHGGNAVADRPDYFALSSDWKGTSTVLASDQQDASSPRFSPDGKRLVFGKGANSIWVHDIARGTTSQVTGSVGALFPIWTPNGERIAYIRPASAGTGAGLGIFWKRSGGAGDEVELLRLNTPIAFPSSWSPDGKTLLFNQQAAKDGNCCEVWSLTLDADGKAEAPKLLLPATGFPAYPAFSPDGRWIAYMSGESGTPQVYVIPASGSGGKWQISNQGGIEPRWSSAGHELFYISVRTSMAVPYTVEKNSFQAGNPEPVVGDRLEMRAPFTSYDVAPDGQHFVIFEFPAGQGASAAEPTVVLNWLDDARQLVAAGQTGVK